MKHLHRMTIAAIACLLIADAWAEQAATSRPTQPPFLGAYLHIRSLFDRPMDPAARREVISRNLDRFKAGGLKVVMPYTTSTNGSAAYNSDIIPTREFADWDPLAVIVEEARKRGLQVWPVVCVITSGHDKPQGILNRHPEWALRDKAGKAIGYISPCHPKAREWMVSVLGEITSKYRPDGILMDYLRFPNQLIQLDPESADRLEKEGERLGESESSGEARGSAEASPTRRRAGSTSDAKARLQSFKEESLTELARMISEDLRKLKPGIRIGIYSWGAHVTRSHPIAQCWPVWVSRGYLDMVSVSGYCYPENNGKDYLKVFDTRMRNAAKIMKDLGSPAQLTFTLGVKTSHGQVRGARDIDDYLRIAKAAGMEGVAVFTWTYLQPYLDEVVRDGYLLR